MRIVMITGSVSREAGGLFWSVRRLSQTLADAGAEVHVFGLRDQCTQKDLSEWQPLTPRIFDARGPRSVGFAPDMRAAIEALKPDVVHLHGIWQALSLTVSGLSKAGYPTMISPRGMLDSWALSNSKFKKRIAWTAWEKSNLRRASFIHVLNATEAKATQEVLPDAEIATIPNGIDIPAREFVRVPIAAQSRPRLLFIGRIHPKKGLLAFLDQWGSIHPHLTKQWVLRIAGPDEVGHLADLQARAATLGLDHCVEFIGPVYGEHKERELREASSFVLPSYSEGLPMAVLEAWAAGLPSFITRECNLPEAFEIGAAIRINENRELLLAGLNDPDLEAVGQRAKAYAADNYGWPTIASRHLGVYKKMAMIGPKSLNPAGVTLA